MTMFFRASACLLVVATCMAAGCAQQPYVTEPRLEKGLVVVLPGIHGRVKLTENIAKGLSDGGVDCAIELYDWTLPLMPLVNLRAEGRNRQEAGRIAERIRAYQEGFPGRPVILVGHSGGASIALWVAEAMGEEYDGVDGVILIAAAVSPDYDLTPALTASRKGIVGFYSPKDVVFLAVGTTVCGTMDGRHCPSAGKNGFNTPETPPDQTPYRKLIQVPWEQEMAAYGWDGSHLASAAERFIAAYVAPLVKADPWNAEAIRARKPSRDPPRVSAAVH